MDINNIICDGCESEFVVETVYSEGTISFCTFCGERLGDAEEDE